MPNILNVAALDSADAVSALNNKLTANSSNNNTDFATILKNAISGSLNDTQSLIDSSEKAEIDFAMGNADNSNELGMALQKASLAVSYTVALRDRFLDAYKEIMQMQI